MAAYIRADQISNFKIYGQHQSKLPLCRTHQTTLTHQVAEQVNALVHSRFFQEQLSSLFPDSEIQSGTSLNIRLTAKTLRIQLLRENPDDDRLIREGSPITITLDSANNSDVIRINRQILRQSSRIFEECQQQHGRSRGRSSADRLRHRASSLGGTPYESFSLQSPTSPFSHRRSLSSSATPLSPSSTLDTVRVARFNLSNLQLDLDRLRRSPGTPIGQIASLEREIQTLQQQIARLSDQLGIPPENTHASSSSSILGGIHGRLHSIDERLNELQGLRVVPAEPDRSQLDTLTEEIRQLRQEAGEKDSRIEGLQGRIDALSRESEEKTRRIEELERDKAAVDEQQRDRQGRIDALSRESEEKTRRIEELERDKAAATDQQLNAESEASRLRTETSEHKQRAEHLEATLRNLGFEKQQLQSRFDSLVDEWDREKRALKDQIVQLENTIRRLEKDLSARQSSLQTQSEETESQRRRHEELQRECLDRKRELEALTAAHTELGRLAVQHERTARSREDRITSLLEEVTAGERKTKEATDRIETLQSDLERNTERLNEEIAAKEDLARTVEEQKRSLEKIIRQLEVDLEAEERTQQETKKGLEHAELDIEELRSEQDELHRQLERLEKEKAQAEANLAIALSALEEKSEELNAIADEPEKRELEGEKEEEADPSFLPQNIQWNPEKQEQFWANSEKRAAQVKLEAEKRREQAEKERKAYADRRAKELATHRQGSPTSQGRLAGITHYTKAEPPNGRKGVGSSRK